ncbi:hypothetical protein [Halalkalibaculum sp. DA384]|uniref:hypothetical protein n=1 Tax=Halalkalibaculum sp. DA384 TaxID=3373606 RepID=UPI00375406CF
MRSHIVRLLMVATVCMGMALYLVRPVQAETASNSFASWLNTVVKKGEVDSDNVRQKLFNLQNSDESLDILIQKASEIVLRNNEDFNLPLGANSNDSGKVYDLLIWEWNSYQTGNGMGKASLPSTTIKSSILSTLDKFVHSLSATYRKQAERFDLSTDLLQSANLIPQQIYHIIPLAGGVAIGAP